MMSIKQSGVRQIVFSAFRFNCKFVLLDDIEATKKRAVLLLANSIR